jgi:alpha-beta hydrolase superfamily lysophospholipase
VSNDTDVRPPGTRAVRRRVTLADRIALRIGMSLIIWSRRTHHLRPSVDLATRQRLERERRERELDWLTQGAAMRLWR